MSPRARPLGLLLAALIPSAVACGGDEPGSTTTSGTGGATTTTTTGGGGQLGVDEFMLALPESCAFQCSDCAEPEQPFDCPTLAPWSELPHAEACGAWDGKYPTPMAGQCTSSDATGEAARPAGPLPGGGTVLPDGRRIIPAGRDHTLAEPGVDGGFPMSVMKLPGTPFAVVSDGGIIDNVVRLVDVAALAAGSDPVKAKVVFPVPTSVFYGMAWLPPGRLLAAGGGDGKVYGFTVDTTAGTLVRDTSADIDVGQGEGGTYYVGAMATTPDGTKLLVSPSAYGKDLRVYSLAAADYGAQLASIPLATNGVFDLKRDPQDATGNIFYATDQQNGKLLEIDLAAGEVSRFVALSKNPSQIAFLDASYLAVASSDGDEISVVDRAAGVVAATVPANAVNEPHGFAPSALAYDDKTHRLYATLAGVNAVEVWDVAAGTPPTLAPAGRIPTAWWPTGVALDDDGSLVVVTGKGSGTGTDGKAYPWGQGPITERMHGSVQHVPASSLGDLSGPTATADASRKLGELVGAPAVTCPPGADDFPIPLDNQSGPSKVIKHVILVVRENKTYDAVFGDRPDLGNGNPALIMASDAAAQAKIWQNARAIAEQFTNFDNFYTDAEQSLQGHTWTAFGRTTDYMERSWLSIWGRASRPVTTAAARVAEPEEGGILNWLEDHGVSAENMGEVVGSFPLDNSYPGLVYGQNRPDIDKACYIGGRIKVRCDLAQFTYSVQSNDHTYGGQANAAAPEVMIAVNDEASGLLLDALSSSPRWQDTLLIITEDDPQDGGDHVDQHRTLLLLASPWVKRGYVSHGHYDMASVYKLVSNIFGVAYPNDGVKNAILPVDAFTSTPDYSPFAYLPRKITAPCNPAGNHHASKAAQWDFDDLDDQPGLSQQIMEMMREPQEKRGVRVLP